MTREMSKPDWHNKWVYRERVDNGTFIKEFYKKNTPEEIAKMMCPCERQRVLNPDIADFFWNCCHFEKP